MKKKRKIRKQKYDDDGAIDMTNPRNIFFTEEFLKLDREQKNEIFFNRKKRIAYVKKIDKEWGEKCGKNKKGESS